MGILLAAGIAGAIVSSQADLATIGDAEAQGAPPTISEHDVFASRPGYAASRSRSSIRR